MAAISLTPVVLKDSVFTLDGSDFSGHVSNVTFTPASTTVTAKGLTPTAVYTDQTAATWTVAITYFQDWDNPESLSNKLFDNEGDEVTLTFAPVNKSGKALWSAQVKLVPGTVGGAGDAWMTATVTLGINGRPVSSTITA